MTTATMATDRIPLTNCPPLPPSTSNMKQIVVPGLFRRRNRPKAAAINGAAVGRQVPDSDEADSPLLGDRVGTFRRGHPGVPSAPIRVIDFANDRHKNAPAATVSTLTKDGPATMKRSEKLLPVEDDDKSVKSFESAYSYDGGIKDVGIGHLSTREQMWYKNQIYLLDKQQKESTRTAGVSTPDRRRDRPPSRLSVRYESANRGTDRYAAGIDKHCNEGVSKSNPKYSPKGVEEELDSTNVHTNTNHCDSRKEARSCSKTCDRPSQVEEECDDDDTRTQSSSLLQVIEDDTCEDTRAAQSSSLLGSSLIDDNTSATSTTGRFGSLFPDDEIDEATLGSTTLDAALDESYPTTLDDSASMTSSYLFELVDDDKHRRSKKYQLGVGQNAKNAKLRKGAVKTATAKSSSSSSTPSPSRRRVVTVHSPRGRRGKSSADDSDVFSDDADACCPFPEILEEIAGSFEDVKSSLNQVLHAFFVSEDDVDRIADKVRDAKLELVEMYCDQLKESRRRQCDAIVA